MVKVYINIRTSVARFCLVWVGFYGV